MRTLLTGGAGFLGSHIARELLDRGGEVLALVREDSRTERLAELAQPSLQVVKLNDGYSALPALFEAFRPESVIHVAAKSRGGESITEIDEYIESNIRFGSHLLNAMSTSGVGHLVNAGTSWQWSEDGSYLPFNYYAATKQCFEDIAAHYVQMGVSITTLRLFDVCGPGDDRNRIIDLLIDAGLTGDTLKMSPGRQNMYLVDVRDAARAFVDCAERGADSNPVGVLALRPDVPVNLRGLVDLIVETSGLNVNVEFGGRPYRPREIMKPFSGAPVPPGWNPRIPLAQTIAEIVAHRREMANAA